MLRYVAFLRGVSPVNARMPELKRCFEAAGFAAVKTVLASGNVVFDARASPEARLQRTAEAAMEKTLGRFFPAIVRATDFLQDLLDADPYRAFRVAPDAKKVVTFLRGRSPRRSSSRSRPTARASSARSAAKRSRPTCAPRAGPSS